MNAVTYLKRHARVALASLLAVTLVLLMATRGQAAPPTPMGDANHAFGEGHYTEAATAFERIIAVSGYSAPLLFDLGNAYLRDGKPVRAILAYERAQVLAPRDQAIATNLAVARTAASAADERTVISRAVQMLPTNTWTWLAAGAFWITVATLGIAMLSKRRRSWLVALGACAAITTSASAVALTIASRDLDRGLVMESAPVLVSPFDSAQSDFALPAGSNVELGRTRDRYIFVHDAHGRSGWVERAQVEPLVPRSS
jgi:tetratricopeptide (TPR) repeat protein